MYNDMLVLIGKTHIDGRSINSIISTLCSYTSCCSPLIV